MGVDLRLHFKKDRRKKGTVIIGLNRSFFAMVGEGKYRPNPAIVELSHVIKMDLSFLLELPKYSDPSDAVYWAELAGVDSSHAKQDTWKANKFIRTSYLKEKVAALIQRMNLYPDYHQQMQYDRESWNDYFGVRLTYDLGELLLGLEKMEKEGFKWVSSEVS